MPHIEKDLRQRRKIGKHGSEKARQRSGFPKDNITGDMKMMRDEIITSSFAVAKKTTKP